MTQSAFRTERDGLIGYAAMLEQFHPKEVVDLSVYAEEKGFNGVMAADHFQPWVPQQGQSAFVWNVLAALGERTKGDFGPGVVAPTFRWHPAMVAQAAATMSAMYPGRAWLGLGSGEALNEHIIAEYWPDVGERSARMFEAIEIMRKLFDASIAGKDVKHKGTYYKMEATRLWTMSEEPPEIMLATAGPLNSKKAGKFADGMITVGAPLEKIEMLFGRFHEGALEAGKDPDTMPKVLQLHLSWAETYEQALENAMVEWPNGGMKFPKADIRSPFDFEQMAKLVRPEDFKGRMVISPDVDEHLAYIQKFADLGFDRIYLHNVGRNQREWIDVFAEKVLPKLVRK
ncbi:TIGR03557 family F420-dependent LLM class oxidoreductase [Devosia sp.]|uniref:TIGR03557 family F420-dependent LLM class oxidoreductase n=1 Tax=Devosia sp. TaxID=1871048 RepID=UPI003A8F1D83